MIIANRFDNFAHCLHEQTAIVSFNDTIANLRDVVDDLQKR